MQTEGPDSDAEDDIIKPNDNLLLVGHVESDASVLEVYGLIPNCLLFMIRTCNS